MHAFSSECVTEIVFLFLNRNISCVYSNICCAVGSQKNRLNETVLLSTQNMLKSMGKKIFTILR